MLIASGDSVRRVEAVAAQLGVREWRAGQLPADKLAWLAALQAAGACVIAIGDGVNDAPVLAGADVASPWLVVPSSPRRRATSC